MRDTPASFFLQEHWQEPSSPLHYRHGAKSAGSEELRGRHSVCVSNWSITSDTFLFPLVTSHPEALYQLICKREDEIINESRHEGCSEYKGSFF